MKMIYLTLISILLWACKHTPTVIAPPAASYCYEWGAKYVEPSGNLEAYALPDCPLVWECPEKHLQKMDFYAPSFNPNNPNQIVFEQYSLHTNAPPIPTLCTFDMCTGEKKELYAPCWSTPDWSIKDWIIFTGGQSHQLFKIKPNGDSLTQLTFDGNYNNDPQWNHSGTKIFFFKHKGGSNMYFLVADETGHIIDTLSRNLLNFTSRLVWVTDTLLTYQRGGNPNNVYLYNVYTGQQELIKTNTYTRNSEAIMRVEWNKALNSVTWLKMHQIGRTNITTKVDWAIRFGADNRRYMNMDVSPDGKTLIVERQDTYTIDSITRYVSSNLYLMNMNGTEERKILIPETP